MAEWRSKFNSIDAAVSITRKIFDSNLLPPHSRTLNHSIIKKLFQTTALHSNRQVSDYYKAYSDRDLIATELASSGSSELRRMKAEIRQYVDMTIDVDNFLETEVLDSSFAAAYAHCMGLLRKRGSKAILFDEYKRMVDEKKKLDWDKVELAKVLAEHGDFRGNIDSGDRGVLVNRGNWYAKAETETRTDVAASKNADAQTQTLAIVGTHQPSAIKNLELKLSRKFAEWSNSFKFLNTSDTKTKSYIFIHSGVDVSKETEIRYQLYDLMVEWGKFHTAGYKPEWRTKMESARDEHLLRTSQNEQDEQKNLIMPFPTIFTTWLTEHPVGSPVNKTTGTLKTSTEYSLFSVLQTKLGDTPAASDNSQITLFDIGILGGLHPRTYAIQCSLATQPENEHFFEQCMDFFDNKFTSEEDSFSRETDVGQIIFIMKIKNSARHTSYQKFEVPTAQEGKAALFGAPKTANEYEDVLRDSIEKEKNIYKNGESTHLFTIENYCMHCLGNGAELYIRLMSTMVKKPLEQLQKAKIEKFDTFLDLFSKLLALEMQKTEISFPRATMAVSASLNQSIKRKRENTFLLHETWAKLQAL